jgi:hypothetical protein
VTPSSRNRPRPRWLLALTRHVYAGAVARDLNHSTEMTDRAQDHLEARVTALEEVLAARWPRSAALRRQLARELRAVDARYAGAGSSFRARRSEWAGTEITLASMRGAERRQGKR